MTREGHVRFCESVGVRFPRATRPDIKIKGQWGYLYRGVDKAGQTIDFFLSAPRDMTAAKRFLSQAIEKDGVPQKITLDGDAASHAEIAELKEEQVLPAALVVRTSRYLNTFIEQDHRSIKQRMKPMLGFKRFDSAVVTLAGIELIHQIK